MDVVSTDPSFSFTFRYRHDSIVAEGRALYETFEVKLIRIATLEKHISEIKAMVEPLVFLVMIYIERNYNYVNRDRAKLCAVGIRRSNSIQIINVIINS